MTRRPCSGCERWDCRGECYFDECPDELSPMERFDAAVKRALELERLAKVGGDPLLKRRVA